MFFIYIIMFIRTHTRTRESLNLLTPNTNMAQSSVWIRLWCWCSMLKILGCRTPIWFNHAIYHTQTPVFFRCCTALHSYVTSHNRNIDGYGENLVAHHPTVNLVFKKISTTRPQISASRYPSTSYRCGRFLKIGICDHTSTTSATMWCTRISLKNDAFQCGITIVFGKRAELSYFCPFRTWLIMCIHIRRAMPWAKETIGLSARLCLFGY